jgi:glycogen debranching enzyme
MDKIKEAYEKALKVLDLCSKSRGFYAAYPGYQGIWARDSVITSLGANLVNEKYKKVFKASLVTLAKQQSDKGQIPNAVMLKGKKIDYKSIDSSLWFVLGHYIYKKRYEDSLFRKYRKRIGAAVNWLSYQDMGEDGLLEQQPTSDWQDAFPHRYGHTINTQALWYKVLNLVGRNKEARRVRDVCDNSKDDGLWNGNYYIPWRWKNHNKYHERGEWFDSLGNLLAIVFDLADRKKSIKILNYIKKKKIDKPYPVRAIDPPIRRGSKDWQDYFDDAEARTPYHYLNGGIWTFIGAFYVLALLKVGYLGEAQRSLEKLAEANLLSPGFAEWIHGKSGKPGVSGDGRNDGNQGWNAGMYVLAYESVKKGKVLI